jgi:MFS family permease
LLDAVSFVVAAFFVSRFVAHRPAADVTEDQSPDGLAPAREDLAARMAGAVRRGCSDAKVGFAAAMAPACRRPLLLTWAGVSFAVAPDAVAAPWAHELGAGSVGLGMLLASGAVGGVVGMLLLGRLSVEWGQRALLPLAVFSLLPLLLAPAAVTLALACLMVFTAGAGTTYSMLARVAFVRGVDDAQRGRAFSVASAGVTAVQGLGIALVGGVASLTSATFAITFAAGLGLLLVAIVAATSPNPLHLPTTVPAQPTAPSDDLTAAPADTRDAELVAVG